MKTVLITRPQEQAKILAHKLSELGFTPLVFPAREIKPVPFDKTINLTRFNKIIFISPSAILNFHSRIKTLPAHVEIFTVGENSAKLVEALGWPKASYPHPESNREALLKLDALHAVQHQEVLLVVGKDSNPELKTVLESRGARITTLIVYESIFSTPSRFPNLNDIDLVICTSQKSLKHLLTVFGPSLKTKTLLVSSPRLVDLAKSAGFKEEPLLAQNAGDEALIKALPIQP